MSYHVLKVKEEVLSLVCGWPGVPIAIHHILSWSGGISTKSNNKSDAGTGALSTPCAVNTSAHPLMIRFSAVGE